MTPKVNRGALAETKVRERTRSCAADKKRIAAKFPYLRISQVLEQEKGLIVDFTA